MLPADSVDALNISHAPPICQSVTPISRIVLIQRPATCPLRGLLLLSLEGLLAVAPYHDNGEEAADDGGEEDDQDDRDANGPDAGKEERVKEVVLVDEGLHIR